MFHNNQFFYWKHFKEKLALHFQKQTYLDAQITSFLTLLQKIEEKYSCLSHQIIVADARISATTVCSGEIASPLAEANSSPVDNVEGHRGILDTFINEHSGHVDNMFDEMSTGVFTEEVWENSPASIFLGDLDDIQSTRVLDEFVHSCCHKVVAEVQLDSRIKMLDEETLCLECSKIQLFNDCSLRSMSKRYVSTTSMDHSSSKQKIEFETLDDMYLAEFSWSLRLLRIYILVNFFGRLRIEFHQVICLWMK
ncbi:hypothetical protein FXO38_14938 [Capsicum annuum]|nr:hypothetical protein FXO37_30964 [Capsicum annuum]KAF3654854.1 hypothetical protein FXO38_14938 [Capsicum annuum]